MKDCELVSPSELMSVSIPTSVPVKQKTVLFQVGKLRHRVSAICTRSHSWRQMGPDRTLVCPPPSSHLPRKQDPCSLRSCQKKEGGPDLTSITQAPAVVYEPLRRQVYHCCCKCHKPHREHPAPASPCCVCPEKSHPGPSACSFPLHRQ